MAEWYQDDSIDEYDGFMSDILHTSTHDTLTAAKRTSKRKSLEHGAMVYGSVVEQEYTRLYGWTGIACYTAEYFDNKWDSWTKDEGI